MKSYHGGTVSTGRVEFDHADVTRIWSGRHVLLLDDILDSGRTLAAIAEDASVLKLNLLSREKLCTSA